MIKELRIYLIARRLQLRDKGELKPIFVETDKNAPFASLSFGLPSIEEMISGGKWLVSSCKHCSETVRIGVKKTNNKAAHWCWRCEWVQEMDAPAQPVHNDDEDFLEENGLRF